MVALVSYAYSVASTSASGARDRGSWYSANGSLVYWPDTPRGLDRLGTSSKAYSTSVAGREKSMGCGASSTSGVGWLHDPMAAAAYAACDSELGGDEVGERELL